MSRAPRELLDYKHSDLMDELNDFMIVVKVFLICPPGEIQQRHRKPTIAEMDSLHQRIHEVLALDAKPMRRYR